MRTKALFAAVLGLVGITSAMAQVYSVNVVGYINVPLKGGFQMVANQLDNGKGNKLSDLIATTAVPDGTLLYKWTSTGYKLYTLDFGAWVPDGNVTLAPGEGCFMFLPGATGADAGTVTFVGDVPQGTALKVSFPAGYWIASSIVPQVADLSSATIGFPAADGDLVYKWSNASGFTLYTFDFGAWVPSAPVMQVGEAFFVYKAAAADWTRSFTVN